MRLDVVAENPLESLAKMSGMLPASVVKVVWSFTMARTLVAAVDLGVFEALGDGATTPEEVAEKIGGDLEATRMLLHALNGFGACKKRGETYTLKKEAARYLTDASGSNMSDALRLGLVLDKKFAQLERAVRTGEREDFHDTLSEEEWGWYIRGLGSLSALPAGEVTRKLKLDAPRRMLDVAGGHGLFSVALCAAHPGLESEVLELPAAAAIGRGLVEDKGASDKVTFREGDLTQVAWGEDYDVVLLFNILHNLAEDDAKAAVHKAAAAVRPGGTVALLEGQHAGGSGDLSFQEGFGELFFWVLSSSMTWPAPTLRGWMEAAGLAGVKQRKLMTLPGSVLLCATRAAG